MDGLRTGALEMQCLGWARWCKSQVECSGWDGGSNTGVVVAGTAIGDQGIRELGKNMLNTMMARLVRYVRGRVIRKVDRWLIWRAEPSSQWNCNNELWAKCQL